MKNIIEVCGFLGTGKDTFYEDILNGNTSNLDRWAVLSKDGTHFIYQKNPVRVASADILKEEVLEIYKIPKEYSTTANKNSYIYNLNIPQQVYSEMIAQGMGYFSIDPIRKLWFYVMCICISFFFLTSHYANVIACLFTISVIYIYSYDYAFTFREFCVYHAEKMRKTDSDYWIAKAVNSEKFQANENIIITDFRYPNEYTYVKNLYDNVISVRLFRKDVPIPPKHLVSEYTLSDFSTDFVLVPHKNFEEECDALIGIFPQYKYYVLL